MRRYPDRVENYTNAFLITAAGTLFMAFFTIAATLGFIWVVVCAAAIDLMIRLRETRLASAEVRKNTRRSL